MKYLLTRKGWDGKDYVTPEGDLWSDLCEGCEFDSKEEAEEMMHKMQETETDAYAQYFIEKI